MPRKKTYKQYAEEVACLNPDVLLVGQYQGATERIAVKCLKCGYTWNPVAEYLLQGYGCPKCGGTKKKTNAEFLDELKRVNPTLIALEQYKNNRTKIKVKDSRCGHEWTTTPDSLLQGRGCPYCSRRRKKTTDEFLSELKAVNPQIKLVDNYGGTHRKASFECLVCGHTWKTTPHNILQGSGCPKCRHKQGASWRLKTQSAFLEELQACNPNIEALEEYQGGKKKILVRCNLCGNEWRAAPGNLLNGSGCPLCYHRATSFMEQFIASYFKMALGRENIVLRNRDLIGMELDVYIPSLNLAIEPGSWVWHRDKLDRDREKRQLCSEQGVRLITIYDLFPKGQPKPFPIDCYTFERDLGTERGYKDLQGLVEDIAKNCSVSFNPSKKDWQEIKNEARINSRRMTTEQFRERLKQINSNVTVLDDFKGSNTKVRITCNSCGHEWMSAPNSLLQGHGCMRCARSGIRYARKGVRKSNTKSHGTFVAELKEINPEIQVLGKYVKSKEPIKVKCLACGHTWSPIPNSLLRGQGCPECGKKKIGLKNSKTHEQFLKNLTSKNRDVKVLGKYKGSKTPILVQCMRCGHKWEPIPNSLLNGRGCPKCAMGNRVQCIETGIVYESFAAAARAVGLSSGKAISDICKGRQKTAAGLTWKLV